MINKSKHIKQLLLLLINFNTNVKGIQKENSNYN